MKYDFDLIVIGLGPAGMAVSIMASEMGLKVCGVEKNKIGGECMNVGCIPSKALLRISKLRHSVNKFKEMELESLPLPKVLAPFKKIEKQLEYISGNKTKKMFDKVDLKLGKSASFIDSHTVKVNNKNISAKRIYIATGTSPMIPPISGINDVEILTNENIFSLEKIPSSMTIIGGGAIGCEMAQAFSRLGCNVTIVQMDSHLLPFGPKENGAILEDAFAKEKIRVFNKRSIKSVTNTDQGISVRTDNEEIISEKLLIAAGRSLKIDGLKLDNAKVKYSKKGIIVNKYLQTSQKHIYAVGDCNSSYLFSHSAMHQGMLALINSMAPWPFKGNYHNYLVPWTVFTEPQISCVGKLESNLKKSNTKYRVIEAKYSDYGAAIAENIETGSVRVLASACGKIYGASIIGEGSGEMINEWALAIQKNIRLYDIMFLQHSFPTMSFLNKRISEMWMMEHMESSFLKKMIKLFWKF